MSFNEKLDLFTEKVNNELDSLFVEKEVPEKSIYKAMRYSIMAGGKRLRPILALATTDLFGGDIEETLPFACSIEMIHTYSLIHDDLPAMDNDDLRRGAPTSHKVFGEALAILAGDALLNFAFELMIDASLRPGKTPIEQKVKAIKVIAKASGALGMIGGQVIDLESEHTDISLETLGRMHKFKTGALIKAPVVSAGVLNAATEEEIDYLKNFSESLGLAFQIKDDILDVEGSSKALGKNLGSDISNNKSTFVTLHGVAGAKKILTDTTNKAIDSLSYFGERGQFLMDLATYLLKRDH